MTLNTLRQAAMNWFFSFLLLRNKLLVSNFLSISILLFVSLSLPKLSLAQQTSLLWGQDGELWTPQSRLPDFSFAGYHMGEDPIPDVPIVANVKDFGAKGDGVTDDSQPFSDAIARTNNGALFIPAGRYKLTKQLRLTKSNFVLRGDGPEKTILYFPKSATELIGRCYHNDQSCYAYGVGAYLVVPSDTSIQELGIEELAVEFPPTKYGGHHDEDGYNAITFEASGKPGKRTHNWIRNVTISNFDVAISMSNTHYTTITGVRLTGRGGHHGIRLDQNSDNNLITNFTIENTSVHDFTVQEGDNGNVFANGSGVNINFDHHGRSPGYPGWDLDPYENLFSNINIGAGSRPWHSSGNGQSFSGPRETFWNIRKGNGSALSHAPGFDYDGDGPIAPQVIMVGATFTRLTQSNEWIEGIHPNQLFPQDLYTAQLARRLGRVVAPAPPPPPPLPPSSPPLPPPASQPTSPLPPVSNSVNLVVTGNPLTGPYAVEARTNASGDVSVHFYVNGDLFRVESAPPYSLFGDNGVPYKGTLGSGTNVVQAKVYPQTATPVLAQAKVTRTATSLVAQAKSAHVSTSPVAQAQITIVEGSVTAPPSPPPPPPPPPTSPLPPVSNSVNLVVTGSPLTGPYAVEARTNASGDVSVHFYVNGNLFRVESSPPYSLFGDNGVPYKGTLGSGTNIVEAKVYSQTATPQTATPVLAQAKVARLATSLLAQAKSAQVSPSPVAQAQITIVEGSAAAPPSPAPSANGKSLINSATMIRSSQNFAKDHPVEHLWDGCLQGTPKCSAGAGNIGSFWVEFDLGKLHDLTSVRLFGDADGNWWSTSWTLEYKQNLEDPWTVAFQNIAAFFNDWSTQSLSGTGRYVRVQVYGNQQKHATQARELEIYGTPQ